MHARSRAMLAQIGVHMHCVVSICGLQIRRYYQFFFGSRKMQCKINYVLIGPQLDNRLTEETADRVPCSLKLGHDVTDWFEIFSSSIPAAASWSEPNIWHFCLAYRSMQFEKQPNIIMCTHAKEGEFMYTKFYFFIDLLSYLSISNRLTQ